MTRMHHRQTNRTSFQDAGLRNRTALQRLSSPFNFERVATSRTTSSHWPRSICKMSDKHCYHVQLCDCGKADHSDLVACTSRRVILHCGKTAEENLVFCQNRLQMCGRKIFMLRQALFMGWQTSSLSRASHAAGLVLAWFPTFVFPQ